MSDVDVAVVGGGASGTMFATGLLRMSEGLRVALIDRGGAFARGVAYSTPDPAHLLNVPASGMSADPDHPSDFARWMRARGEDFEPDAFVPRSLYGAYLDELLEETSRANGGALRLRLLHDEVLDVDRADGVAHLHLRDGSRRLTARWVVLATGNPEPAPLRVPDGGLQQSAAWLPSPWNWEAIARIPPDADVFLLGTGLTAVDVVLTLRRLGHRGRIHALSRHGRLPNPHAQVRPEPVGLPAEPAHDVRRLLAQLREASGAHDWRGVVDGLRPHTIAIWQALPLVQRRRFLRHLRSIWEVHRHRMAPSVAAVVEAARRSRQFELSAGRLQQIEPAFRDARAHDLDRDHERHGPRSADSIAVAVAGRRALREGDGWRIVWRHQGEERAVRADVVVNCTGPSAPGSDGDPLGAALLSRGLVRRDALGLGLESTSAALVAGDGSASSWLFGLGPLLRAELWECTAIPELREQARALAQRFAAEEESPVDPP